ncbi:MAG: ABC transporter permease [Candidatus Tectomicrobia bacterium]|nr:ABC transporter permease [Candidatus Tectomicrobia bacterium]
MKPLFSAVTQRKFRRFRESRRGFYSLIILGGALFLSLFAEFFCNSKPLLIYYEGAYYFPIFRAYSERTFGGDFETEADYRDPLVIENLQKEGNWVIYPLIRHDYRNINHNLPGPAPSRPTADNWLGTDDRGRDVLARLIYGFRLSLLFGLLLASIGTVLGIIIGAVQGYFGGWLDLLCQRAIEVWSSLPELYLLIILSAIFTPSIPLLIGLLSMFGWMGLSAYVRAEFLRARNFDYVKAARALGVRDATIMVKHLLPNTLTPVITFLPFRISGAIVGLTSLDFLGLGVRSPTPSLGELLRQATGNVGAWWLSLSTFLVLVTMIILLNFIGEAILKAFDPRRQ